MGMDAYITKLHKLEETKYFAYINVLWARLQNLHYYYHDIYAGMKLLRGMGGDTPPNDDKLIIFQAIFWILVCLVGQF